MHAGELHSNPTWLTAASETTSMKAEKRRKHASPAEPIEYPLVAAYGSGGVKWGQVGSRGVRWGQVGSGGVRWGRVGSGGVRWGRVGYLH